MIVVNTTLSLELVQTATSASHTITDALATLNRITTHDDWACKERDTINEYIITNKNRARQLQENMESFLNAIRQSALTFENVEASISDMFSNVDSLLSDILSITEGITSVSGTPILGTPDPGREVIGRAGSIAADFLKNNSSISWDNRNDPLAGIVNADNIAKPIAICKFPDINLE